MNLFELENKAIDVRKGALKLAYSKGGHIGGTLSSVDIITALFYKIMNYSPQNLNDPDHDRFILSKGHTVEGYLWALADCGFFEKSELETFNQFGSIYSAHPNNHINGVELSTGALGHGLSLACGVALAGKLSNRKYNTFVLMGDGETNEGSVWEAALFANSMHLDNLYVIVDRNRFQISGPTEDILPLEPYCEKWRSFGFDVWQANGNDMGEMLDAFDKMKKSVGAPKILIANTTKGKGVSFMENNVAWHYGKLNDKEYVQALEDLETARRSLT